MIIQGWKKKRIGPDKVTLAHNVGVGTAIVTVALRLEGDEEVTIYAPRHTPLPGGTLLSGDGKHVVSLGLRRGETLEIAGGPTTIECSYEISVRPGKVETELVWCKVHDIPDA